METKKQELLDILNNAWRDLGIKPNYTSFNSKYALDPELMAKEIAENKNPKFYTNFEQTDITMLTLIATITECLTGTALAAEVNDDDIITGWSFVEKE